jgi:3-oxoacyl-[acyl-carrier protein] reductase
MASSNTPLVALITGASGVIGGAIASALAASGAKLILHANKGVAVLEKLRSTLKNAESIDILSFDLSLEKGRSEIVDAARKENVNILVNNAGIVGGSPLFAAQEVETSQILDVSYTASLELSEVLLPQMLERGFGRIINISSVAGLTGDAGRAAYAAAKAALVGLTRRLARTAHDDVTVNAVLPGFVAGTPATGFLGPDKARKLVESIPSGRFAEPVEIASLVAFLASRASAHINGAIINVDGGLASLAVGG